MNILIVQAALTLFVRAQAADQQDQWIQTDASVSDSHVVTFTVAMHPKAGAEEEVHFPHNSHNNQLSIRLV